MHYADLHFHTSVYSKRGFRPFPGDNSSSLSAHSHTVHQLGVTDMTKLKKTVPPAGIAVAFALVAGYILGGINSEHSNNRWHWLRQRPLRQRVTVAYHPLRPGCRVIPTFRTPRTWPRMRCVLLLAGRGCPQRALHRPLRALANASTSLRQPPTILSHYRCRLLLRNEIGCRHPTGRVMLR